MTTPNRRVFLKQLSLGALAPWLTQVLAETPSIIALPRALPEDQGIASAGILAFLKGMEEGGHELHSFMLLRHGKVVAEGWWAPYAAKYRHTMYSMSKSFTSTAVGFAVAEGRFKVSDKVVSFFPDDLPETISENLAALTVKDLLSMAVGHGKDPTQTVVKSENWVKTFLAQPIKHKPGTFFVYNSVATYMCSAIVQKLTGEKIVGYLKPRLFDPLFIKEAVWETCPMGINTGGWGLSIPTEAMARFGQLYLQRGEWKGKQILPAAWVEEATTFKVQQPAPDKPTRSKETNDWQQGYCYQFWRSQHNGYRGDGAFGQFTLVMPEQDAVLVMTSESKNMQGMLDVVWEHLFPAIKPQALPRDEAAYGELKTKVDSLKLALPEGKATSELAGKISGKKFAITENSLGITDASISCGAENLTFTVKAADQTHTITCSLAEWALGEAAFPGTPPRLISGGAPKATPVSKIAANATWTEEKTLTLTWRYIETPHRDTVTCRFEGEGAELKLKIGFKSSIVAMKDKATDTRPELVGVVRV